MRFLCIKISKTVLSHCFSFFAIEALYSIYKEGLIGREERWKVYVEANNACTIAKFVSNAGPFLYYTVIVNL